MKNRLSLILLVVFFAFSISCEDKDIRINDFFVEFATVIQQDALITFRLDDGTILTPQNQPNLKLENDYRVILNYTSQENSLIIINSVKPIFADNIKEEGYPDEVKKSPIKIISAWVSGNYLNISFQVDYHSKPHSTALYRDMSADKPTLYLSYSRGEDPPGAPTLNYISFNLKSLQEKEFTLYINTHERVRKFALQKN